jgi:hypothetical protein
MGHTCILIARVMTGRSLRRGLHLVNYWLNGRLMEGLDLSRLAKIDRCTHRALLEKNGLAVGIVARMIGVEVGTIGSVRDLRLEVNARVGLLDVAGHVVDRCSNWCDEVNWLLLRISSDVSGRRCELLSWNGRKVSVLIQVTLTGVVDKDRLTSRGDGSGRIEWLNTRNG